MPSKKSAQWRSFGAALAVMGPMEDPAQDCELLRFTLQRCVTFHRVTGVMAMQAQAVTYADAKAIHPEPAIVQQGIDLTIHHLFVAQVDRQNGVAWYPWRHVGGWHGHADGVIHRYRQCEQG